MYDGTPVNEMIVKEIESKDARPYIATFHYSKTMPDSTKYVYAGFLGEKLCGIVVYGMGAGKNQYTSIIPNIQNGEYVELTRLWCANDMPKNTESKLISESLKMLPLNIKLVISFADSSKNHVGTIYQATNWYYLGKNNGGKTLICEDGVIKHARLLGIYKMRHPHLKDKTNDEIMEIYGWKWADGGSKHRYIYLRGNKKEKREMFKKIKGKIESYPKQTALKTDYEKLTEKEIYNIEKSKYNDLITQTNIFDFI